MHSRTVFLSLLGGALLFACGGDDSTTQDGGNDATSDSPVKNDSGGQDATNDTTTTDSGGDSSPQSDAGDGGTIGDGGTFACGTQTCNSATQYCTKITVGPDGGLPIDSGLFDGGKFDAGSQVDNCVTYPASCSADGGKPSCSCVQQGNCTCNDNSGAITLTCP